MHKQKLQTTTARIDNSKPSALQYPIIKAKKERIIEERCTEIEKANRILLERMTSILKGPATHTSSFNLQANETAKGIKRSNFNSKL
jgi:hypothetical protein